MCLKPMLEILPTCKLKGPAASRHFMPLHSLCNFVQWRSPHEMVPSSPSWPFWPDLELDPPRFQNFLFVQHKLGKPTWSLFSGLPERDQAGNRLSDTASDYASSGFAVDVVHQGYMFDTRGFLLSPCRKQEQHALWKNQSPYLSVSV